MELRTPIMNKGMSRSLLNFEPEPLLTIMKTRGSKTVIVELCWLAVAAPAFLVREIG